MICKRIINDDKAKTYGEKGVKRDESTDQNNKELRGEDRGVDDDAE